MSKEPKTIVRYSISFKQQVVKEIEEEGLGIAEAARRYGIKGGSVIQTWLRLFGKNHLLNKVIRVETKDEKDRLKALEAEIKRLKLALADSTMENRVLNEVIKQAGKHYKTDLKKTLGAASSQNAAKKDTP